MKNVCWLVWGVSLISPLTDEGGGAAGDEVLCSRENRKRWAIACCSWVLVAWGVWFFDTWLVSVFWQLNMRRKRNVGGEACGTKGDFGFWNRLWRSRFMREYTSFFRHLGAGLFGALWSVTDGLRMGVSSRRFRTTWFS